MDNVTDIFDVNTTAVAIISSTNRVTTSTLASSTSAVVDASAKGCKSLAHTGLSLSSTSNHVGAVIHIECDGFAQRPIGGINELVCLNTSNWSPDIPSCQWSWDLTTQEKIIFGTAVAAGSFIIVIAIAICIAYFCCYKKRRDDDEKMYDSSYHGTSPPNGYDGPYPERDSYPITYLAYQDIHDGKTDGYTSTGTLDKPWLGYIPRPKVTEGRFYN